MKWNDEEGFFEIEAESNTTFQTFEGIRNTKDSSVDLEKIRNSDNPASGYIIFAIDGDTMDGLCEGYQRAIDLLDKLAEIKKIMKRREQCRTQKTPSPSGSENGQRRSRNRRKPAKNRPKR